MQTPISELLIEAATLMVTGMAFVFVFLTLLIGAVRFIGYINNKLPAEEVTQPSVRKKSGAVSKTVNDTAVKAAISAAVHQYRQENNV